MASPGAPGDLTGWDNIRFFSPIGLNFEFAVVGVNGTVDEFGDVTAGTSVQVLRPTLGAGNDYTLTAGDLAALASYDKVVAIVSGIRPRGKHALPAVQPVDQRRGVRRRLSVTVGPCIREREARRRTGGPPCSAATHGRLGRLSTPGRTTAWFTCQLTQRSTAILAGRGLVVARRRTSQAKIPSLRSINYW